MPVTTRSGAASARNQAAPTTATRPPPRRRPRPRQRPEQQQTWLTLSSTTGPAGAAKIALPDVSRTSVLAREFDLPAAPRNGAEAVATMRGLLAAHGGLPTMRDYIQLEGVEPAALQHAALRLFLRCLDAWAGDPANAGTAFVGNAVRRRRRRHQLCPVPIMFADVAGRERWCRRHPRGGGLRDGGEWYGTMREVTAGHRVGAANLYLVADASPFADLEQTWSARITRLLHGDDTYQSYLQDWEVRGRFGREGGETFETAVLIGEGSRVVYIRYPLYGAEYWHRKSREERRLGNILGLGRVRALLAYLKKNKDKGLRDCRMFMGGLTIPNGSPMSHASITDFRGDAIRWTARVVAGWMGILDQVVGFEPQDGAVEVFW